MSTLSDKMRSLKLWSRRRMHSASKAFVRNASNAPSSPLLHLPLDIWYLIFDHLAGFDLLRLSGSCKDLRALIMDSFPEDLRNCSPLKEKFDFFSLVADTFPDVWVCIQCSRLHEADVRDLPTSRLSASQTLKCDETILNPNLYAAFSRIGLQYATHLRHVQLALKYASMASLEEPYKQYFADLMAPCELSQYPRPWRALNLTSWIYYHAAPKIVTVDAGTPSSALRYVLHEKWTFRAGDISAPEEWTWQHIGDGALRDLKTCCHLDGSAYQWPRPSKVGRSHRSVTPFRICLEKLLESRQKETMTMSCRYCPTDVAFCLNTGISGHEYIAVHVWKDLDPSKNEWLIRTTYNDRRMKVPRMKGYIPGATRHLYENDGQRLESTKKTIIETLLPSSATSAKTMGRKRPRKPPQKLYSDAPSASGLQQKRANQMALAFF